MARKLSEKEIEESRRTYVSTLGKEPSWFEYVANNMGETLRGFDIMRESVYSDGALSKKTKQLLFIAMNLILRNEQGLALHLKIARNFGATNEEIAETFETVAMFGASLPLSKIGLISDDLKR